MTSPIEGVIPILLLPFREDQSVDLDGLAVETAFLVDRGVCGLGVGYGSELPRLTESERLTVTKLLVEQSAGRSPVMASVGADSTYAAITRAEAAAEAGAELLMIAPPTQPSGGLNDILGYYSAIADRVPVPIVVQDAPTNTGVSMPPAFLGRLTREVPTVAAIKIEELPTSPKIRATVPEIRSDVTVLGGAGGLDFYNELSAGARGTVPGACHPEIFVRIHRLYREGDADASRELWMHYLPFLQFVSRSMDVFLLVQKEVLCRRGVLRSNRLRSPGVSPDPTFWQEVDELLQGLEEDEFVSNTFILDE